MKEIFLIAALALPASGSSWFGSERGAVGHDPKVQVYNMLMQHINLNFDGSKRALVIGLHIRLAHELRGIGLQSWTLSPRVHVKSNIEGSEATMPIRENTMALVINVKPEPQDAWLSMRIFQNMIRLVKPWGFLVIREENNRWAHWLPKWQFNLLPFYFSDGERIWQRGIGNGNGNGTHNDVYYRHLEVCG